MAICERTGLSFEARSKRQTTHPTIRGWIDQAYKDNWYDLALETLRKGREAGYSTPEQFVVDLRAAQTMAQAEQDKRADEAKQRERDARNARQERAATNDFLRGRGYVWRKFEYDEEDQDMLGLPAYEWSLHAPDGRSVTVKEAMQELAFAGVTYAKEWLAERAIAEEMPLVERERQKKEEEEDQRAHGEKADPETLAYRQQMKAELLRNGLSDERATQEAYRLSGPHHPSTDYVVLKSLNELGNMQLVLNGDIRYGVLISGIWNGIDEVKGRADLEAFHLEEYSKKNEELRVF